MKSVVLWALVVVNVLLLAMLAGRFVSPNSAMAARGRRPDLMMIPGEVLGGNSAVIFLIDSANRRLGAVGMGTNNRLEGVAPIDLTRAFEGRGAGADDDGGAGKAGRGKNR